LQRLGQIEPELQKIKDEKKKLYNSLDSIKQLIDDKDSKI
jgi:hypothetical protein